MSVCVCEMVKLMGSPLARETPILSELNVILQRLKTAYYKKLELS
jgi:hypothetical protein